MASLNDTRKQLDELEAKVKSLTIALDKLKGASGGDTELISYFSSVKIEMQRLVEEAKLLKTSISGIGASGVGIDTVIKQVDKLTSAFDKQLDVVKNIAKASGDSTIITPTTFKADSATKHDTKASISHTILNDLNNKESDITKLNQQAQVLGLNVDKINSRLSAMSNTIKSAFYSGDIERARSLMNTYANEVDKLKNKIDGQSKAQDIAQQRQRESIRGLYEETKNYVSTQEALSGQRMSYTDQTAYYDKQAAKLKSLGGETREYIEILKLKNQAEAKAAEEAQKAAEKEKQAHEDAVKAARDRVNNTLGTIKRIADGVNSAVNKVVNIIRNGIKLINKVFSTVGKFVGKIATGAKAIVSIFGSLSNRVRGTAGSSNRLNGSFNILAGTATELRSKIMLLKGAFDALFNNQMVKKAENLMASVYSLKNIAGSGVTQEVLDWANSMEYAFGISAKELIGDINELTGVLYGLGMTAEDTAVGSENLLMMSRYLAFMGAAGGDTKTVMTKLVSGMKGMTQAIDDLGLSVRDAQMDTFLKSLKAQGGEFANIATDFSSLNEEARVYVRYAALIDQFTRNYNITNFANALDTVTGRMQIMKQTAASLVTTIGTGLTKAISKLAIFIVPLLKTIEAAVTKVFAFFGIDVSMTTDINEGTDAVDKLNGGLDGTKDKLDETKDKLDKVGKSANKAKGSLQSFDRVNNVTSSKSSNSKSGSEGSDGFDYKKLMTSMLGDLNKLAEEASQSFADKMQEKMKETLKTAWNKFVKYAKKITGRNIIDLEFDWNSIKKSLKNIWKNIKTLIKSWGTFFIEIGIKFLDDINIGKIITKFLEFVSAVTDLAVAFSEVLIPVLRNFYDEVLSPIVKLVGEKIADAFDKATEKVKAWTKYLKDNKPELIEEWTEKLKHFFNVVTGKESANPEDGVLGTVLEILNKVGKVIKALIPIVSELASALGVFLKEEFLPWLNEKLGELAKWLSENKDDIVKFLKEIAGFVWDSFKIFVDLVGKLVDFCVKHPTAVKVFLESLVAIKIASWATSTAAGIGQLVFQLGLLSKIKGVTKPLSGLGTGGAVAEVAGAATETAAGGAAAGGAAAGGVALGSTLAIIAAVIAAVVALIAIIKDLWNTSEGFRDSVTNAWEKIKESIESAKEKLSTAFDPLKKAWDNFYQTYDSSGLKSIFEELAKFAVDFFSGSFTSAINLAVNLITTLSNILADLINIIAGVIDVISGFVKIIVGAFTGDLKLAKEGAGEFATGIVEIFTGLLQAIIDLVGGAVQLLIDLGGYMVDGLKQGISEAWSGFVESVRSLFNGWIDSVKKFFGIHSPSTLFAGFGSYIVQGLLQGIQGMWQTLVTGVTTLCTTFTNTVKNILLTIINVGTRIVKGILNGITSTWQTLVSGVTSLATSFTNSVKTILLSIKGVGTTLVNSIWSGISSAWSGLASGVSGLCSSLVNNIKNTLSNGWNTMSNWLDNTKNSISTGWNKMTGRTTASTAKTVTTHAVGGSIAGGQLFIANENGQPELIGNIDGSPKTNVANNNMIIEAMTDGVFTGVYNALAEVSNQRGTVGGGATNAKIEINGFGLIDSSTLSELARLLAPYLGSNNKNIADINFSI